MVLYHRSTISGAREIIKNGFGDEKWSFGLRDALTGETVKAYGVWLTDRPLSVDEGPPGDAILEVHVDFSEEALQAFELVGVFQDARLWVVPTEIVSPHSQVRILAVDPGVSGQFEAIDGDLI
jgi:hypothetical protein